MEAKSLMNPNSIMFEADSTLDKGTLYPFIENCIIANQKAIMFSELHFGHYIEAIMIVVQQYKLGDVKGAYLLSTSYRNIQKAKAIVEKSILNN
jgi:hypothetical protein